MRLPATTSGKLFWLLNALLAAAFLAEFSSLKRFPALDGITIALAAVTSLLALNRQLPLQNILPAALIVAFLGSIAHLLTARTGFPFGPLVFDLQPGGAADLLDRKTEVTLNPVIYTNPSRMLLFGTIPWFLPFLWVAAVFFARGVARLILRPWRKVKNYGIWLIGLTALLAMTFDFAMEPSATAVKHWWHWQPTKLPITWGGATVLNFIGWLCMTLLMMLIATPFTIPKQRVHQSTPDIHPLCLWLGALLLFGVGAARAGYWAPVAVDAVIAAVTTVLAVRGAKW